MITNILLSAYLVNKAVDTYLMLGMVLIGAFVLWIVFRITRKSAKNEAGKDCKNQKHAGQTKPNSTVTSIKS